MTSARFSLIVAPSLKAMLLIVLSFHIGFILVSAVVVCAILEMISGFDPPSVTAEPR